MSAAETLHIQKLEIARAFPCLLCRDVKPCTHLDWDLSGYICTECARLLTVAEIQLRAWLPANDSSIRDLIFINQCQYSLKGRHWNSPQPK